MSDYPNMSYCMIENTTRAMDQIISALAEVGGDWSQMDLNQYERSHVDRLASLCREYLDAHDEYDPNALDDVDTDDEDEDDIHDRARRDGRGEDE
jgi:hypothetical protein